MRNRFSADVSLFINFSQYIHVDTNDHLAFRSQFVITAYEGRATLEETSCRNTGQQVINIRSRIKIMLYAEILDIQE
jgi:hypothetical protein